MAIPTFETCQSLPTWPMWQESPTGTLFFAQSWSPFHVILAMLEILPGLLMISVFSQGISKTLWVSMLEWFWILRGYPFGKYLGETSRDSHVRKSGLRFRHAQDWASYKDGATLGGNQTAFQKMVMIRIGWEYYRKMGHYFLYPSWMYIPFWK